MIPDIIKNPYRFAESWYRPEEIASAISRRHLGDRLLDLPTDVDSTEFAEWLCQQYRLAMAKGASMAMRAVSTWAGDGFITCESSGDGKGRAVVHFESLADAQIFHRMLCGVPLEAKQCQE